MASHETIEVARKALAIYDQRLKTKLEHSNIDDFVAIEPESGDFFLARSLSEAIQAARAAHPERLPFALRVGHKTAVELGVMCP
jgi:hypothetical protein